MNQRGFFKDSSTVTKGKAFIVHSHLGNKAFATAFAEINPWSATANHRTALTSSLCTHMFYATERTFMHLTDSC